ncbi:MAG: heavy-metal-associated domain-containing protein [Candidatus Hodarchaeales archaeon]|jgi:copper chaperone
MSEINLKLSGLTCGGCIRTVTKVIESVDGVQKVNVDLTKATIITNEDSQEFINNIITEVNDISHYKAELI